MGALICIYIFLPLIKHVYDTNQKTFLYFIIITGILTFGNTLICYLKSFVLNFFFHKNVMLQTNYFNIFNPFREIYGYTFVYFCLGGLMHTLKDKLKNIKKINIIAIISLLVSCSLLFITSIYFTKVTNRMYDVGWYGYDTIFTLINVIAIFTLALSFKTNNRIINKISQNSLGIYFIHQILIHLTKSYITKITFLHSFTGNILYAMIIILISLLISLLIKKLPLFKKLL